MRADMSGSTQKTAVSSGRSPCAPRKGLPMSERQQLALVMQLCASDKSASTGGGTSVSGTGSPPAAGVSPGGSGGGSSAGGPGPSTSTSGGVASRSGRGARNERGETPLHLAAIRGDVALTRRLLSRGTDPNCTDFAGWTPLHEASNRGRLQVAEWLLRAGADVNARGLEDDTPLHDAAVNGHSELVKLLLRHGADQHQKNRRGQTPRQVAAPRVITIFLQNDPNPPPLDDDDAASPQAEVEDSRPTTCTSETTRSDSESASRSSPTRPAAVAAALDQTPPRDAAATTSAAPCEMRRAPTQNKVDKTGSPRVTLRLHQVKGRDDKRSSQQQKGTDAASYETRLQFSISMDQGNKGDDVYEFKSSKDATPVTGSPPDAETSKGAGGGKDGEGREQPSTSPGGRVGTPGSPGSKEEGSKESEASKRGASEMDGGEDGDEENKRKKRKEDKSDSKESSRNVGGSGRSTGRNGNSDKSGKNSSTGSKGSGNGKSSVSGGSNSGAGSGGDRKSPSNSGSAGNSPKAPPSKPSSAQGDSESDGDDGKKDAGPGSGPKVPPLKIVIPQQSSTEQEQGTRNGKNGNSRHQALPYVVTSSNDSEQGAAVDKLDSGAGCSGMTKDEKKDAAALQEERSQRVLRSSHRSSNHGSGGAGQSGGSSSSSSLPLDSMANSPSPSKSDEKTEVSESVVVDVHPRKRKIKANKESSIESSSDPPSSHTDVHPHDQPITNCYEMFLNIRKQIDRRRKGLFPVQPKPPQGFKDYLMNRCTYVLAGNATSRQVQMLQPPPGLAGPMRELFTEQEKERYRLCLQHVIEKEKLVLSVEQEILRVHGRAARALANQSLPFSVCTILKDEEVYNVITPEQEEKDRNARSRYNGRLFLSWLQDVDDKWEKIKENMLLRHHNEAESLHAVQKMDWEWKLKEHALCEFKAKPVIDDTQVPIVHVSDDFDLLPA